MKKAGQLITYIYINYKKKKIKILSKTCRIPPLISRLMPDASNPYPLAMLTCR